LDESQLIESAKKVLDGNWTGSFTIPSGTLYPHQWSWDSCMIAMGNSYFDTDRSMKEMDHLFDAQWKNGMIPHIVFNEKEKTYFPSPEYYDVTRSPNAPEHVKTSGMTQPPVHAIACFYIHHNSKDKAKTNEFSFLFTHDEIVVVDAIQKSPVEFNLLMDHRSVNATVVDCDASGKKISVEVDGEIYEVEIMDELDQMLDVMGFGIAATKQIKEIKAPMPGMVLEIAVTDGQEVAEGEKVLILGAMKMENSILIQTNATIKRVAVGVGQAVEKGQVLVELE